MFSRILLCLSAEQKSKLRAFQKKAKRILIQTFRSYDKTQLIGAFRSLGIERGDALMVHSGFDTTNGFTGSPNDFIDVLLEVLGPEGHLLMVSMPYMSSTYDYLSQGKIFDVRKTVSHMGVVSETFRRRGDVLRSQHPTHPILAKGPKAAWLVEQHENCLYPCGKGTPFEKLLQLGGKVLFFDASFFTLTFFHYLEERIKHRIDFPLFFPQPFEVPFIDREGSRRVMRTYVYTLEANRRRRPQISKDELDKRGLIKYGRIGKSFLQLVRTEDLVGVIDDMAARGVFFYV
jgi:aminoglycoside 3-N-acetyltransferase